MIKYAEQKRELKVREKQVENTKSLENILAKTKNASDETRKIE